MQTTGGYGDNVHQKLEVVMMISCNEMRTDEARRDVVTLSVGMFPLLKSLTRICRDMRQKSSPLQLQSTGASSWFLSCDVSLMHAYDLSYVT